MTPKHFSRKAVWAISLSTILAALLLVLAFVSGSAESSQTGIVLPSVSVDITDDPTQQQSGESDFLEVTNDNVITALQTLHRPGSYYQQYSVSVGTDEEQMAKRIHLWVSGNILRAEVRDDRRTKHLLTDGLTAYLWYDSDFTPATVSLSENLSEEDLLGIPDFDGFLTISAENLEDSGYVYLEEPQVPCIYAAASDSDFSTLRYWVNLDNGLLYQADALDQDSQIYVVRQEAYESLTPTDERFSDLFRLPDGSSPFTAEEQTQQP